MLKFGGEHKIFKIGNNSAIMQRQHGGIVLSKCPEASALLYHFLLLLVLCVELFVDLTMVSGSIRTKF